MFDNILFQAEAVESLSRSLLEGSLPPSILFWGEAYSGKLTCALELARVLSCETGRAEWNCPCTPCERHRTLSHPDLLLLGNHPFMEEIRASVDMLAREKTKREKLFFIRAVRKLERRFDPALFEGEEGRLAKAAPLLDAAGELLSEFCFSFDAGREDALVDLAGKTAVQAEKLSAMVQDSVPIFQVRNAAFWARLSPLGRKKTIILENADEMLEASRNALLKILEEPPKSLEIVLIATRRKAILPTILSRVRPYGFGSRSGEEVSQILAKIFRTPATNIPDLKSWFSAYRVLPSAETERLARGFLAGLLAEAEGKAPLHPALVGFLRDCRALDPKASGRRGFEAALAAGKGKGKGEDLAVFREIFPDFIERLSALSSSLIRRPEYDAGLLPLLEEWSALLRSSLQKMRAYNLNPSILTESLYYSMRASI